MSGRCEWCVERYGYAGRPDRFASDPRCALASGTFVSDNWQCAGLSVLREDAESVEVWDDDQHVAVLPLRDTGSFIVLSYYKHRGRTEGAWRISCDRVEPLTVGDVRTYIAAMPAGGVG